MNRLGCVFAKLTGVLIQADLEVVDRVGRGRVDLSIGSALDIFGGNIRYDDVVAWNKQHDAVAE